MNNPQKLLLSIVFDTKHKFWASLGDVSFTHPKHMLFDRVFKIDLE